MIALTPLPKGRYDLSLMVEPIPSCAFLPLSSSRKKNLIRRRLTNYKEEKRTMNKCAAGKSVWVFVLAILFSSPNLLFAGSELTAGDGKDYSKEVVPIEKSWCETLPPWEIRIGAPGWLAGISGESGV